MTLEGVEAIKAILNGGRLRVDGYLFKFDFEQTSIVKHIEKEKWEVTSHTFTTLMEHMDGADRWAIIS